MKAFKIFACLGLSVGFLNSGASFGQDLEEKIVEASSIVESDSPINVGGQSLTAKWFVPQGTNVIGWVWLQHGFARSPANVAALAREYGKSGLIVVTPSLSLGNINDHNFAKRIAADLISGKLKMPSGGTLPENFVLAGHSAGGGFVTALGAALSKEGSKNLKGVLLLDAVDRDNRIGGYLDALKGTEVLAIQGKPHQCNAQANGIALVKKQTRSFKGLYLSSGSHCDAEGSSTNFLCTLVCGSSSPTNVKNLQEFSTHWILGFLEGQPHVDYVQGGEKLSSFINSKAGLEL